jgi:hypothetical protein
MHLDYKSTDDYNFAKRMDSTIIILDREICDGDPGYIQQYREYLDGFMDGCLDVEGNDKDICSSTMEG